MTFGELKPLKINYFFFSLIISDLIDFNGGKISEGEKQGFSQILGPRHVRAICISPIGKKPKNKGLYLHIFSYVISSFENNIICIGFQWSVHF